MPPAVPSFGVIADDLTGANAVAAMAARTFEAWTVLGPIPASVPPAGARLVAVDAASRDGGSAQAAEAMRHAVAWLRRVGIDPVAKRIDTTLRGHIGIEVEAVRLALGGRHIAVVVPALPAAGRTARGGRVYLHGRPLAEVTGLPDDAARALRAGSALDVVHVPLETVRAERERLGSAIVTAHQRRKVLLCDAETDADIDAIAAAVAVAGVPVLPVDPGPFTLAVAGLALSARVAGGAASAASGRPVAGVGGPVLAVFGSAEPAAHRQVERAIRAGAVRVWDVPATDILAGRIGEIAGQIGRMAGDGGSPIGIRVEPAAGMLPDAAAVALYLGAVVLETLRHCRPAALYLSGGTIARAVLNALGADGLRIVGEIQPLAARGYLASGAFAGLPVVTKGGLAGSDDAVTACLLALSSMPSIERARRSTNAHGLHPG